MRITEEGRLKDECKKFLEGSGWYYRSINIVGIPGRINPSKGMPDAVTIRRGRTIFLEFKAKKGVISPEQEEFIFQWNSHSGECYVIRSLEDLIAITKRKRYIDPKVLIDDRSIP